MTSIGTIVGERQLSIRMVERTIADLEGSGQIRTNHLAEAISYRMVDQTIWGNQKR